jgi:undecaprenyl-diphosphatase
MLGASAYKLVKFGFSFTGGELITIVLGMAVAFFVSLFAIRFLMSYINKHDFKLFGYYRIILGIIIILAFSL